MSIKFNNTQSKLKIMNKKLKIFTIIILILVGVIAGEIKSESRIQSNSTELLIESQILLPSQLLKFPIVGPEEHSMTHALPHYVHQKISISLIKEAIDNSYSIEIIECSPAALQVYLSKINSKFEKIDVNYEKKTDKEENFRRPVYYKNDEKKILVLAVIPGEDYLKQYTALVCYYIKTDLGKNPDNFVSIIKFPLMEKFLNCWTNLDEKFVKPNDTVLIGNISNFFNDLKAKGHLHQIIDESENCFYKSTRVKLGNRTINFLRVKYSFWGDMSAKLVNKMLSLGAIEIIYMSKIATLNDPSHIYTRIYSPTQFLIFQDKQVEVVNRVTNPLVEKFPELDSGTHISLSTVMEQDFKTAAIVHSFASSLDLEVSKIAKVIAEYNQRHNKVITFIPIHWVTDYIRTKEEAELITGFDLANGDSKSAKEEKSIILEEIYQILTTYLMSDKQ